MPKIKTKNEQETAKGILEEGKKGAFWKLIVDAIDESIQHIQKQQDSEDMQSQTPEMYKLMNELFKAKKNYLETLKNTPDNLISWLGEPVNDRKEFDPYDK